MPSPLHLSEAAEASDEDIAPAVRQQAAQWLLELQADEVSEATRRRWQQWRAADPAHERAWQRMQAFASQLQHMPAAARQVLKTSAAPGKRRRVVLQSLAVAALAVGAGWVWQGAYPGRPWRADKRTGTGEQAQLHLPDGSDLQLGTATAIAVRFGAAERGLHLLAGELLVNTAPDGGQRPFVVHTRQGRMQALGTRFWVRTLDAHTTRLAVYEGAVRLQPAQAGALPQLVQAGQQVEFTRQTVAPAVPAAEASIAWTQGLIVAQDMPLGQFLDELARHRPGHLGYADTVAQLKVSGVYPLADTDRVLAVLESSLPVRVRRTSRYWVSVQPK